MKGIIENCCLKTSYEQGDAFVMSIYLMLFVSFCCWILSLLYQNHSQVDRIWSIVPFVYSWHFSLHSFLRTGQLDARLSVMSILATLWGLRLSYNFYRKGGYNMKDEDYRWPELRRIINNRFLFELFNISFIALYQNILLLLIALPAYYAYLEVAVQPWNVVDTTATLSFLLFLLLESISDQQQWNFQTTKYSLLAKKEKLSAPYSVGFNHTGLFAYSRHPNFFAEMSIWWCFYLFSCCHAPFLNQTILGTILLTLLFQGSTLFTENITKRKYPEYAAYQQSTSRFFPMPSSFKPSYLRN